MTRCDAVPMVARCAVHQAYYDADVCCTCLGPAGHGYTECALCALRRETKRLG